MFVTIGLSSSRYEKIKSENNIQDMEDFKAWVRTNLDMDQDDGVEIVFVE